jgi:hypothetical protein
LIIRINNIKYKNVDSDSALIHFDSNLNLYQVAAKTIKSKEVSNSNIFASSGHSIVAND